MADPGNKVRDPEAGYNEATEEPPKVFPQHMLGANPHRLSGVAYRIGALFNDRRSS